MKKVAFFLEGQTELIFVREVLLKLFNYSNISLDCIDLIGGTDQPRSYSWKGDPAKYYFYLINVGNDNSVISSCIKRNKKMLDAGYEKFICLRDMYCKQYKDRNTKVDWSLISAFIAKANETIVNNAHTPDRISLYFAIMEVEAWFLGFQNLFERYDEKLTADYILENLKINLKEDPENLYFHPSEQLYDVLDHIGKPYKKTESCVSSILSKIETEDLNELDTLKKCASFSAFYKEIKSFVN